MSWHEQRFTEHANRLRVECSECGRPYWLPPSKAHLYVTCGGVCSERRRLRAMSERCRNCATCGTEFFPRAYQLANGGGMVCSQKCNVTSHTAMNSLAAQVIARLNWRRKFDTKPFILSGEQNPMWTGGRRATYLRRLESGAMRETANTRRLRGGARIPPGTTARLGSEQRWKCAACKVNLRTAGFHLDHVMPLALGGTNAAFNFQLLCPKCNRVKNAKHPVDFMQSMGYLL